MALATTAASVAKSLAPMVIPALTRAITNKRNQRMAGRAATKAARFVGAALATRRRRRGVQRRNGGQSRTSQIPLALNYMVSTNNRDLVCANRERYNGVIEGDHDGKTYRFNLGLQYFQSLAPLLYAKALSYNSVVLRNRILLEYVPHASCNKAGTVTMGFTNLFQQNADWANNEQQLMSMQRNCSGPVRESLTLAIDISDVSGEGRPLWIKPTSNQLFDYQNFNWGSFGMVVRTDDEAEAVVGSLYITYDLLLRGLHLDNSSKSAISLAGVVLDSGSAVGLTKVGDYDYTTSSISRLMLMRVSTQPWASQAISINGDDLAAPDFEHHDATAGTYLVLVHLPQLYETDVIGVNNGTTKLAVFPVGASIGAWS